MLKRFLRPSVDYKFVPDTAWDLLCSWYGTIKGQPAVGEKVNIFQADLVLFPRVKYCVAEVIYYIRL